MKCVHIAKQPHQEQADVTIKQTGVTHTLCMACYGIFKDDPRQNPVQSEGYNIYRSADPLLPKDQWTKVNDKPIPRTDDKMQFKLGKPQEGASYYITAINAIGLESYPGKVVYIPGVDAPKLVVKSVLVFGETTHEER
jgi:hypothetical protein